MLRILIKITHINIKYYIHDYIILSKPFHYHHTHVKNYINLFSAIYFIILVDNVSYYTTGGPFLPDFPKGYAKRVGIILGTGATLITLFTMYTNMPGQRVFIIFL